MMKKVDVCATGAPPRLKFLEAVDPASGVLFLYTKIEEGAHPEKVAPPPIRSRRLMSF